MSTLFVYAAASADVRHTPPVAVAEADIVAAVVVVAFAISATTSSNFANSLLNSPVKRQTISAIDSAPLSATISVIRRSPSFIEAITLGLEISMCSEFFSERKFAIGF